MTRKSFRDPGWISPLALLFAVISFLVAWYFRGDEWWLTVFFVCFGGLCLAGALESRASYMQLGDDELEFRRNFQRTIIEKSEIERVTWESGCGVSVKLRNGSWVAVPSFAKNSQGITNSIRAWLTERGAHATDA